VSRVVRFLALPLAVVLCGCGARPATIAVGSKNFTEQIILAELLAQHLEARAGLTVERRVNLGGTLLCHEGLLAGELDLYVEYTGTALTVILDEEPLHDPRQVYDRVRDAYRDRFDVEWTEPLGFNNTFAIVVRGEEARRLGIDTVSAAVPHARRWRAGVGYEFMERADGWNGLVQAYGLRFARPPMTMELGLIYRALQDREVDLIAANSTDGVIEALDMTVLQDDRHYFPPYEAAPIVRRATLARYPALRAALAELAGVLDEARMRRMNFAVDGERRQVREVVAEFRRERLAGEAVAEAGAVPRAGPTPSGPGGPGDGTARMAARLDELVRATDPSRNRFANSERVAYLRQAIEAARLPAQRIALTSNLADELLKINRIDEAIALATPLLQMAERGDPDAPPLEEARDFLALCHMRRGEQENCIARHNVSSCLLPIRAGVHERQEGSREAMRRFTDILRHTPDDLGARWLLNIAAMTVGEYPAGVPEAQRIPPGLFEPEARVGRFRDVAPAAGIVIRAHAGGAIMEDFDGDGLLDLLASSMGLRDPLRLYHNDGNGRFTEIGAAAGLSGEVGGLNMVQADYDNDGDTDVLLLRGGWMQAGGRYPNSLLRNNGDGTFSDVTEAAGILSFHPTQTAAWGDYDGDGRLDLAIGNESIAGDPHPTELYSNNGDGTFSDRSAELGDADLGYVKAVIWGDVNNDGRPDLYLSILNGDNRLLRNDGPRERAGPAGEHWRFTDIAAAAGVRQPRDSFPSWFWDYDNDGWLDILAAGYRITDLGDVVAMHLGRPTRTELPRLYRNNGDGTFTDATHAMRLDRLALPMGCNLGDLDNDGWMDAYFGTGEPSLRGLIPNRMFRNDAGRGFQEVTTSADVGHLQKGHGVAFGDIDNDGDQDIFEEMGGWYEADVAYSVLYLNPGHCNRFITLRLEGRKGNRSAIGARIRVRVTGAGGTRDIHLLAGSGGSFGGNSLQQEIGLGRAAAIEEVEVVWPLPGGRQRYTGLKPDRVYRLVEGEASAVEMPARRFGFPAP